MKVKNSLTKIIVLALVAIILLSIIAIVCIFLLSPKEPTITTELIASKLEAVSELTTAQLTYNGLLHYEEGTIPFLTRNAFFMIYCAEVEAGIDLSQVKITVSDTEVNLVIPNAEILDIYIDPATIEFYNEGFALFNWSGKEDAIDALAEAEEDVRQKAGVEQLLETANAQTQLLLENLLKDAIGDRTLVIRFQE